MPSQWLQRVPSPQRYHLPPHQGPEVGFLSPFPWSDLNLAAFPWSDLTLAWGTQSNLSIQTPPVIANCLSSPKLKTRTLAAERALSVAGWAVDGGERPHRGQHLRFRGSSLGIRVGGLGLGVQGSGFMVWGLGFVT